MYFKTLILSLTLYILFSNPRGGVPGGEQVRLELLERALADAESAAAAALTTESHPHATPSTLNGVEISPPTPAATSAAAPNGSTTELSYHTTASPTTGTNDSAEEQPRQVSAGTNFGDNCNVEIRESIAGKAPATSASVDAGLEGKSPNVELRRRTVVLAKHDVETVEAGVQRRKASLEVLARKLRKAEEGRLKATTAYQAWRQAWENSTLEQVRATRFVCVRRFRVPGPV